MAFSEPARVVEVTIAKSARESFLREVKVFADTFAFHSSFSPSRANPDEPFPMLWRDDFIVYFYPIPNGDARRQAYQVSVYSRGPDPVSQTSLDQLVRGLESAVGTIEGVLFTISR